MATVGTRLRLAIRCIRHYSVRPVAAIASKGPATLGSASSSPPVPVPTAEHPIPAASIHHLPNKSLCIDSPQRGLSNAQFSYLWLRDACLGPNSVDPGTKQKLFRSSDIPHDIYPMHASLVETGQCTTDQRRQSSLKIVWSQKLPGDQASGLEPDVSIFPLSYLASFASRKRWEDRHHSFVLRPKIWARDDLDSIPKSTLYVDYGLFKADEEVRYKALQQLVQYGLLFFTHVPTQAKEGWNTELKNLVEYMGELRRTFYGDLWDVRSEGKEARNVAYTNLNLDLHMDLVHFQNPPRFQFLHMLRNWVVGGSSTFVDAFAVAARLFQQSPETFSLLCDRQVAFEYINNSHHTHFEHPTIELKKGWTPNMIHSHEDLAEALFAANYSPPFQGPLITHPPYNPKHPHQQTYSPESDAQFMQALKRFADICAEPQMRVEVQLDEGVCAAFDNRRVLHARTAFQEGEVAPDQLDDIRPDVKRWLKGAYIEGDSVWDRLRVLDAKFSAARAT